MVKDDLSVVPEDLYHLGNSSEPRLTCLRSRDLILREINGIVMVVANGGGIAFVSKERLEKSPMTGWVWRLNKHTAIPSGLILINDRPGHYCIAPKKNMPLSEYLKRLAQLAPKGQKLFRKEVVSWPL
jgi:hypothetical protein